MDEISENCETKGVQPLIGCHVSPLLLVAQKRQLSCRGGSPTMLGRNYQGEKCNKGGLRRAAGKRGTEFLLMLAGWFGQNIAQVGWVLSAVVGSDVT